MIRPVLVAVATERVAQDAKWGEQNHESGTGRSKADKHYADAMRAACDEAFKDGYGTWRDILSEEVYEAFAESDPEKLRAELVQVAAVVVAWIECLDRKGK